MAVGDVYVFPGFLTPVLTQLFFPKPPTTFLTCFCRGKRRKYAGKKSRLNRGSNSQPPGHESDTLTTEPPGQIVEIGSISLYKHFCYTTHFTLELESAAQRPFLDRVDQEQTAQNVQFDLGPYCARKRFLCPHIEISGAYCFTGAHLSVCLFVCRKT